IKSIYPGTVNPIPADTAQLPIYPCPQLLSTVYIPPGQQEYLLQSQPQFPGEPKPSSTALTKNFRVQLAI
ncbi:hypothetical protein DSO57_1033277, partial [Entomophthora muscae]